MLRKQLSYATFTDVGDREINEDSLCAMERDGKYCFAVCDGLGGHGMGDAASRLVVEVFQEMFEKTEDMSSFLPQAIQASQDILMAEQKRLDVSHKMKTTVAAMVSDGKRAYIGHVGDSRVYVFRHNKVLRRTLDHSIPQMLVLTREIKEEEIRNHPDRNVLLQSVGTEWEEPMYELMRPVPLWRCQGFLLCSSCSRFRQHVGRFHKSRCGRACCRPMRCKPHPSIPEHRHLPFPRESMNESSCWSRSYSKSRSLTSLLPTA